MVVVAVVVVVVVVVLVVGSRSWLKQLGSMPATLRSRGPIKRRIAVRPTWFIQRATLREKL